MRSKKKIAIVVTIIIISAMGFLCIKKLKSKTTIEDLVNISSLSQEFMDNYLSDVKKIKDEDKENLLIVTSKKQIKNTYGASKIISAPNNQYYLQYETEDDKDIALKKFKGNNDPSLVVSENIMYEISDDTVLVSNYNSWGIEAMGIDTLLESISSHNLNDITVAIIDTGLDIELFNEKFPNRLAGGYNVLTSNGDMYDHDGHGTHIAGTIAEATPNNVKILPIKVSNSLKMYTSDIIAGINYVTYNKKADIMNMSFLSYNYSYANYIAIEAAEQNNIVGVAAAGNDNTSANTYPAAFDNTISIAAVDSNKEKADFSNYGNYIMFSAPGVNISSINGTKSGTSMATPHAVSAIALLKSLNNDITFKDITTILRRYSEDLGDLSWDEYYGFGFINFENAEICDGTNCDEFNIFKKNNSDNLEETVESYEIIPVVSIYEYGTINNILETEVVINYTNGKSISYNLYDFPDLEISGYDPKKYSMDYQTVNIKFTTPLGTKIEDSFKVRQIYENESVWEYNKIDDYNVELTGFKDVDFSGNTLYIPNEIDGYNVIAIADGEHSIFQNSWDAFKNVNNLFLPSTLTKIGDNAFYNQFDYNTLGYVKSDAENLEIGNNAFRESGALVTIDANISNIGDYAFYNTTNLMNVKFSDNMTYIGASAFEFGLKNANITIPKNVIEIGNKAFSNSGIKEITFLNKMNKISDNMFLDSQYLEKVVLPENLKEIGESAFEGSILKEITLPETLIKIGNAAFKNSFNKNAEVSLTIPENVSEIGNEAFMTELVNKGLKEIIFLNNLEIIPDRAFFNNNIEKIILPENLKEIKNMAFAANDNLKEIYLGKNITTIGDNSFVKISPDAMFYVYNNTYPETYTKTNDFNYKQIDPDTITVKNIKTNYFAFEKVDLDTIAIELTYSEKTPRTEVINKNIEVEYESNTDGFRYGDTSFKVITYNDLNYKIEKTVEVEVSKAIPEYTIPTDLTANIGQTLSEIELPEGFEWINENQEIIQSGEYEAKYVPNDTNNYEIINNIKIKITVIEDLLTVTYHSNNEFDEIKTFKVPKNSQYSILVDLFQYEDHRFKWWNTKPDGSGYIYGDGRVITITDDLDLYAVWLKNKFTLTYIFNDDKNTIKEIELTYPEFTKIIDNNYEKKGYSFVSWNSEPDGTGKTYNVNNTVQFDGDMTLYAIWEPDTPYKIDYYTVDEEKKYIDMIEINTDIEEFTKHVRPAPTYSMSTDNVLVNDKWILYTGGKTTFYYNGSIVAQYTNIIRGDVNGDAKVNYLDYVKIYNHIYKTKHPDSDKLALENEYLIAADISKDDNVNYMDYVMVYNKIKELKEETE